MIDFGELKNDAWILRRGSLAGKTSSEVLQIMQLQLIEKLIEKIDDLTEIIKEDKKPTTVKKAPTTTTKK